MEEMKQNEVCPKCGKIHEQVEHLGIMIDENDVKDIRLIIKRIEVTTTAMNPGNIPDGLSKEKLSQWVLAFTEALANYQQAESDWWQKIVEKYNLPKGVDVSLDSTFKEFVIRKQ